MKHLFHFRTLKSVALMLLSACLASSLHAQTTAEAKPKRERILLVGDSTVASQSGWGDAFARLLKPAVECINMGRGGRSSKSYRDEKHWEEGLKKKPTWILIQFGHNDQPGKGPKRETDPQTTYRENLKRYIKDARDIGAKPVLVTSLTRRNFNSQGKIVAEKLEAGTDSQGAVLVDSLNEYVKAARIVAAEEKVPLLDLNARSIAQLNELGPEKAIAFDAPIKLPAPPDKTHLSETGAAETAKLIADEILLNAPDLATLLIKD